jgi:hypothetical protein
MFSMSPRFLMSPRFFALPVIALAIIVALAHASSNQTKSTGTEMAVQKVRATVCSTGKVADASCSVVRDDTRVVR